jgi:DNA-binding CsgD family transcriptional regulator
LPDVLETAVAQLAGPGLVVLSGGPGCGRSTLLRRIGEAFRGPVFTGGGLAMLRAVPGFALARAVRVRLPAHDPALLAEAVRSRVRNGLLLLDDLQWADPATVDALPAIARHCRIAVTLRTPNRLDVTALRAAAGSWLAVPPLPTEAAADLVRAVAPKLGPAEVAEVVRRAGGAPLAVEALARHAAARRTVETSTVEQSTMEGTDPVSYAVAAALADLTRPARTAMAALGLLGRPAAPALLGSAVTELVEAGLVELRAELGEQLAAPVSPYVAEVAAGLLDAAQRRALHRRLAGLVPPREAVRHLAAAGEANQAYRRAIAAAASAAGQSTGVGGTAERAELLSLACELPGVVAEPPVRLEAARLALAAGWPRTCLRVLGAAGDGSSVALPGAQAAVLRGEALLQRGDPAAAAAAVAPVGEDAAADIRAARDRILLLDLLGRDRAAALAKAAAIQPADQEPPRHPGLRAALAAVRAAVRTPGWEYGLAAAAEAAGVAGDALAARWSAWLLVETLVGDGRLAEAGQAASTAAAACAADVAYSWQTRFLAAQLWCSALRGDAIDEVVARATDLTDRTVPSLARGYAAAAAGLAEADGGLLASARTRVTGAGVMPASAAALLDWVAREAAWLDGQPERATAGTPTGGAPPLVDGLRRITARWAAFDTRPAAVPSSPGPSAEAGPFSAGPSAEAGPFSAGPVDPGPSAEAGPFSAGSTEGTDGDATTDTDPQPVRQTLEAWAAAGGNPERFDKAAEAWHELARREEIRCLLAHGLHETDPQLAVPPLLRAEQLAASAGMVVLLGRTRRALRRHSVRRDVRGPRSGDDLTDREREVLRLVARGEPTRRIAGQLGISRETVETHIRAGMRKLGARTRTEAAAIAMEVLG